MSDTNTQVTPNAPGIVAEANTSLPKQEPLQHNESTPSTDNASSHLVPVIESIRYRKRAQAAEQELSTLQSKFADSQTELAQLRDAASTMERRQKIDALLADADAVDFDVARLLAEAAVEAMDQPDVQLAIDELRRSKPYLFTARRTAASAMGARSYHDPGQAELAADAAARSGDRRDLLRYLRLRRNGQGATV